MGDKTGIQWTDATWNPIRGCSMVSAGCTHCYAQTVAHRFSGQGQPYEGLVDAGGKWNGTVRFVADHLKDPLRWSPRRVFVNSMSDMFHEGVSDETIDRIFAVMALAPQHRFQILTKRPEGMQRYLTDPNTVNRIEEHLWHMHSDHTPNAMPYDGVLANVWLGVSVENQDTADERIPLLLRTPAAVRFISAEPLLGPVTLEDHLPVTLQPGHEWRPCICEEIDSADRPCAVCEIRQHTCLDWVIVGGETGPGARPCDVAWVRSILEQCQVAGVACFVKQLGAVCRFAEGIGATLKKRYQREWAECIRWPRATRFGNRTGDPALNGYQVLLHARKGDDPAEWPAELRVREWPQG